MNKRSVKLGLFIGWVVLFASALFLPFPKQVKAGLNTTTIKASYHNWTDSGYPTYAHYNGQPYMNTGYWSSDGRKLRSWVHFDLSSIPAGATISSASFNIWLQQDTDETDCYGMPVNNRLIAGQVHTFWDSSMNWNNQPNYVTPAIYYLTSFPCDGQERFYYIAVTQAVKNWVESGQGNYGFVLLADEQGASWSRRFTSSTGAESEKPQLFVQYITPDPPADPPADTTPEVGQTEATTTTTAVPAGQSAGSGVAPATSTTASIKAPTDLKITYDNDKSAVKLSFSKSATSDIDGYKIFRSEDRTKDFKEIGKTNKSTLEYLDLEKLTVEKTYYYFVRAYKGSDESASSSTVDIKIPTPVAVVETPKDAHPILNMSLYDKGLLDDSQFFGAMIGAAGVLFLLLIWYEIRRAKKGQFLGGKHFRIER